MEEESEANAEDGCNCTHTWPIGLPPTHGRKLRGGGGRDDAALDARAWALNRRRWSPIVQVGGRVMQLLAGLGAPRNCLRYSIQCTRTRFFWCLMS